MIIGGDITASLAHTTVAVTLLGEAEETNILYRHGAKPGDYLCVSGHLGGSYAGLKILQHQKGLFHKAQQPTEFQPNLEPYAPSIQRHLMPQPRLDISKLLTTRVTIHSLIDISDGLASEVHHLCQDSAVGASVYEHNIPVHSNTQLVASKFSESVIEYALYGGEEYELLFTLDDKEYEKLEGLTDDVTIIGRIIEKEKGIIFVRENGESEPLSFGGWNHFK